MRRLGCFALLTLLGAARGSAEPPAGITNARLERRAVAAGRLAEDARGLIAAGTSPFWIGYSVPANERHQACCWSSPDEAGQGCGGCRLEAGKGEAFRPAAQAVKLESGDRMRILVRAEGGRVSKIKAFSGDCWLDVGGLPLFWLDDVRPAESVALLSSWVGAPMDKGKHGKGLAEPALMAIAFHGDPSADAALEGRVAAGEPLERRRQAAFWLGNARGARGYEVLRRLVREDADPRFREHVVFALTQSRQPGAIDAILDVAKRDESAHVRGQALFWLAQSASHRAADAIRGAIEDDPEVEVKKKAVFALSQLPKDEGVPMLIKLARTHRSLEVRKQAMFWLGQSGDPRALTFFEDVLKR